MIICASMHHLSCVGRDSGWEVTSAGPVVVPQMRDAAEQSASLQGIAKMALAQPSIFAPFAETLAACFRDFVLPAPSEDFYWCAEGLTECPGCSGWLNAWVAWWLGGTSPPPPHTHTHHIHTRAPRLPNRSLPRRSCLCGASRALLFPKGPGERCCTGRDPPCRLSAVHVARCPRRVFGCRGRASSPECSGACCCCCRCCCVKLRTWA